MSTVAELSRPRKGDEPDDVLFSSLYGVRLIELNRPKKLNSLNASMARKILPRLKVRGPVVRCLLNGYILVLFFFFFGMIGC